MTSMFLTTATVKTQSTTMSAQRTPVMKTTTPKKGMIYLIFHYFPSVTLVVITVTEENFALL